MDLLFPNITDFLKLFSFAPVIESARDVDLVGGIRPVMLSVGPQRKDASRAGLGIPMQESAVTGAIPFEDVATHVEKSLSKMLGKVFRRVKYN